MIQTVEAIVDEPSEVHDTALLSGAALAEDWNRPEEDAAWSHLQPLKRIADKVIALVTQGTQP